VRRLVVLGLLLLGFVAAYVVLDLVAKGFVERRVEDEFVDGDRIQVEEASFAIDSFPFLVRLGAYGEVSATLHLGGIREQGVAIDAFDLEVDGRVLDRTSACNGDVQVTGLDRATTTVSMSEGTIGELIGIPVDVAGDGSISAGGATVQAELAGGDLVLTGEGIDTMTVPIRLSRFLPCDPDLTVGDEQLTLTCVTDDLPPIVNRVLGEASERLRR
jgi:hypothetical protein